MKSALVFPLALISFLASRTYAQCDACFYTADDASDCKDYGQIGGETVAWPRASQDCLDVYQIKVAQQDVSLICTSATSFINAFRLGDLQTSDAALGLGAAERFFFEQDESNNNIPKLKDNITIDGTSYNCVESSTDCWNAMKLYYEEGAPGESEKDQICETLENKNRVNLQLEQSTARIRLCDELRNGVSATECTDLETMIQEMGEQYPDLACSAYGFGVGDATIPGCEGLSAATPAPSSEDTSDGTPEESTEPPEGENEQSSNSPMARSFIIIYIVGAGWFATATSVF